MPLMAEGKDDVFVGRLRRDFTTDNALNMWVVSDNLRKGAATNTVQIAEVLLEEGICEELNLFHTSFAESRNRWPPFCVSSIYED